jgi:hypothetical protein
MTPPTRPLLVEIHREPFEDFFTLKFEGNSEDLEADAVREWFKKRGANMDVIELALDRAWNFYRADVTVKNPLQVSKVSSSLVNLD